MAEKNLILFDLEWNIGYKPYTFNYHGVEQVLRGEIINSIAIAGIMTAAEVLAGRGQSRPVDTPNPWRPQTLAARRREADVGPDLKRMP